MKIQSVIDVFSNAEFSWKLENSKCVFENWKLHLNTWEKYVNLNSWIFWVVVEISNDQMENDQYFEILNLPMLKVTIVLVIWFFIYELILIVFELIIWSFYRYDFNAPIFYNFQNLIFFEFLKFLSIHKFFNLKTVWIMKIWYFPKL